MLKLDAIDHVAFTVSDTEKSAAWYSQLFDMERVYAEEWSGLGDPVALCNGIACVALFRNRNNEQLPTEPERGGRHFAFRVDQQNFELMQERLTELGIAFRVWDHKVCSSIYINDPDGYQVEVTYYYK